ncbi:MAG TPA: FAD-linked oxidase C-terminal domain-containing protein, partial [Chloroflexota bacterium]
TELTLRVHAIPERVVAARRSFADVESATRAVVALTALSTVISRLELLDGPTIAIINAHFEYGLTEVPTLFVEYGGSESMVDAEIALTRSICSDFGLVDIVVETGVSAQRRLWDARHNFGLALMALNPGKTTLGTDVAVPISELPGAVALGRRLIEERGLMATLVAHAGDGNFHFVFVITPETDDLSAAKDIYSRLVDHALSRGGTASAEHGIGVEKQEFLIREHGELIPAMRAVKAALDPAGILNPGKIFAAEAQH